MSSCCFMLSPSRLNTMAMKVYKIAYRKLVKLWFCGYYLVVQFPTNAFWFCWKTQLYIIHLPLNLTYKTLSYIKKMLKSIFFGSKRKSNIEILKKFMECELDENKGVLIRIHELQSSSLTTVAKMDAMKNRITNCESFLAELHRNAKIKMAYDEVMTDEDKFRQKVVLLSLRETLKKLKNPEDSRTTDLDNRSMPYEDQHAPRSFGKMESFGSADNQPDEDLPEYFAQRRTVAPCNQVSYGNYNTSKRNNQDGPSLNDLSFTDENENETNLLNLSIIAADKIIAILKDQNEELEKRLVGTSNELDDARESLSSLSDKVSKLESLLEQAIMKLISTEAERDAVLEKLTILNGMIEEQEIFFDDDCGEQIDDDEYKQFSVQTKRISLQ